MQIATACRDGRARDRKLSTMIVLMFVVSVLVVCAPAAWAQSIVTGGLSGVVSDHSGAVVGGARLTLKSSDTGDQYSAVSSANGDYSFSLLKPGMYSLTVQKDGFTEAKSTVDVKLGTTTALNLALEVGAASTTVEVTGETALLQTEDANISTNFETQQIREIPNPGGDITYVAQTAPGVVMNSNGSGFGNFSTFGLPGTANLFTVNGNDYNDPFLNLNNSGSSNLTLGGNELQQVAVVNNAYTAQYGRQAGSQVDYSTRSGTNSWHGNAVYNWTGRYLNANDPVTIAGATTQGKPIPGRPFENNNQWAGSFGGPILKNKAYFFFDTEGIRYIFATVNTAVVPTPAFETAALAHIPQDAPTQQFYSNMFSLYNAAPGISNATAGAGCSELTSGAPCTESWTTHASSGNHEYLLIGRVDVSLSDKDKIFGRTKFDRGVQPTYTDLINSNFNTFSKQPQDEGQLNYTHVFTPNVVNNFIGSVLYYSAIFGNIAPGAKALNLFPGVLNLTDGSLTNLGFGSGLGGYAQQFFFPQGRNVTQWGLVDDLSIVRGNHALKMGVNFRRDDVGDHAPSQVAFFPAINTTLSGLFNDVVANNTNYNFAMHPAVSEAFYSLGMYFQDEFRVSPNLKLTMALRADRNSGGVCHSACAVHTLNGFQNTPHGAGIPYDQSFISGGKDIVPGIELVAFQPRFGVAWSPRGKSTVIRTGVGLFTDLYPAALVAPVDTNFPQVNLWAVPGGSLAWDLNSPATTAFPNSGVAQVQQCNTAFTSNYNAGGSFNTYQANAPLCASSVPAFFDVNRNLSNPKYVEWNFEIEHSIGNKAVVSANYVGNRGFDELYRNPFLNANDPNGFGGLPTTAPDPRVSVVQQLENGAVSNYNGLTLSYQQNSWHGLSGRINYTYSHALDEVSNGGQLPFSTSNSLVLQTNPYNIRNSYGSSDYDARHSITGSYVYQLPFKSPNRLLDAAIGGWQLSGTMFWHTSFPFTVVDGASVFGLPATDNIVNNVLGFPEIILQPEFSQRTFSNGRACINTLAPCFGVAPSAANPAGTNPNAPFLFAPATGFTGSMVGRNAFRGPGFLGGDFSVRKNFKVTERVDFQLGLNAYNFLNHANYFNPNANTAAPNFGAVVGTQFTPTSPYGAFALAATDMRIAALEGKITF